MRGKSYEGVCVSQDIDSSAGHTCHLCLKELISPGERGTHTCTMKLSQNTNKKAFPNYSISLPL